MSSCNHLHLPVAILLDNVRSMYNVGAFFRAADGVGLEKLCLCGITAHPRLGLRSKKAISKTALGAEETVRWEHDWDAVRMAEGCAAADLKSGGWPILALFAGQPRIRQQSSFLLARFARVSE